ncbi:regulatory protein suaprga1 [Stereum hirsutum FP-91666 SS1]|uniref:regulatory protein suaprga1 n=1 Tax=Stereum hirsutum (strain FP-91666) TaxID=721885 RepID=UPI000440E3C3|nr:regulatory protein suaprga1 [Stereum hirsutum FP-91666 SS1]EIM88979.1 regulatory protein suaprga1 [Stereum hirsutum FP-91666 SS1]
MSALRCVRQIAASSSRTLAARSAISSAVRLPAFAGARIALPATRSFSVSFRRFAEADIALSQKLAEELQYEKEAASEGEPEFLTEFKKSGVWTIEDTVGSDEITLTRKYGNEEIRLIFSIADIQTPEENDFPEEEAEGEEGASSEDTLGATYPLRCSFSISKPTSPGALTIDAMCQEGQFIVDNISFYGDKALATELTAEADWKRRGLYIGPQFDTLDVSVQDEFDKFLEERGINESLAFFVPEYAEFKEQKEYVRWLNNVKTFIDV